MGTLEFFQIPIHPSTKKRPRLHAYMVLLHTRGCLLDCEMHPLRFNVTW